MPSCGPWLHALDQETWPAVMLGICRHLQGDHSQGLHQCTCPTFLHRRPMLAVSPNDLLHLVSSTCPAAGMHWACSDTLMSICTMRTSRLHAPM